jgi:hypothetical protein
VRDIFIRLVQTFKTTQKEAIRRAVGASALWSNVLTVVLCGPDETLTRLASESGAEAVIVAEAEIAEAADVVTHNIHDRK